MKTAATAVMGAKYEKLFRPATIHSAGDERWKLTLNLGGIRLYAMVGRTS